MLSILLVESLKFIYEYIYLFLNLFSIASNEYALILCCAVILLIIVHH